MRSLTWVLLTLTTAAFAQEDLVRGVLQKHCMDCHDSDTRKGSLDLEAIDAAINATTFPAWVRVYDNVRSGEMPPRKHSVLPQETRDQFEKALHAKLMASEPAQRKNPRSTMRRLTRAEYENTIQDLFGMPALSIRDLLPEDECADANEKRSTELNISKVLMMKYLECADAVLDAAIVHQDKPLVYKSRIRRIGGPSQFCECYFPIGENNSIDMELINTVRPPGKEVMGLTHKERMAILDASKSIAMLTCAKVNYEPRVGDFSAYHAGNYRIRISTWSFNLEKGQMKESGKVHGLALYANDRMLTYFDAPSMKPQEQEIVTWLNPSESLTLNASGLWPIFSYPATYNGPCVAVDWIDIEGPLNETWPPAAHKRLFGDLPISPIPLKAPVPDNAGPPVRFSGAKPNHEDGKEFQKNQPVWTVLTANPRLDAERLLKDFLSRAFRRPVSDAEVTSYVSIAMNRIGAGDFFEIAMRAAYKSALCSPDFLFLSDAVNEEAPAHTLTQYALASRLSYFLWNSMPDEVLMKAAAANKLQGADLTAQVNRMLADPRSNRLVNSFLDQWIDLRKINGTSPDMALYPEFHSDLRDAMVAETRTYFREMLDRNIGVRFLVDSDFLTINQRLAEHYGIPGVSGYATRKIARPKDSPRGGLVTQAAVLKVTSNGTTTSPVLRGAWIIDRILGNPPKPPPPNTPAVDPDLRGTVTIREQLDTHRNNESCASCHRKIDPPGFALEGFDPIGGWRTRYRHNGTTGDLPERTEFHNLPESLKIKSFRYGLPVDSSGESVDGTRFQNIGEFKKILLANQPQLARNLTERLIYYSTGTPVEFPDRENVERIVEASRKHGYGVRTLVHEIVQSPLFQRK